MRKIEYAVGAAGLFIQHLHREGFDRGLVATFGNNFRVEQNFTGNEGQLHATLARVARSVTNERTRLYDSIEDAVIQFAKYGDRHRPWLLVVITDGQDNESHKYRNNPAGIGYVVGKSYNAEPSNFIFVIGVGSGTQIDPQALGAMGDNGNFLAMSIAAFPLLEMAFLQIAVQVSEHISGRIINRGNVTWAQLAQIRQTAQIPFDYAFLIDRSGSMNEPG